MEDLGPEKSYVFLLFYCEQIRLNKGLVSWFPSSSVSLFPLYQVAADYECGAGVLIEELFGEGTCRRKVWRCHGSGFFRASSGSSLDCGSCLITQRHV